MQGTPLLDTLWLILLRKDKLLNSVNVLSIDCDYANSVRSVTEITRFFLKHINKVDLKHIIFSQVHSNIFYTLDPLRHQNKKVNLTHIDEHHDYYYKDVPINSFQSDNWLGYYLLNYPSFIVNCHWLHNINYEQLNFIASKMDSSLPDDIFSVSHEITDLSIDKFDYIFVCESPHYSNPYSLTLYNVLVEIIKNNKQCEKNKFFKPNLVNHVVKEIGINIGHATQ